MLLVADSSVLINFLRVNRLEILTSQSESLFIVDEVAAEVIKPDQKLLLDEAIRNGTIKIYKVTEIDDLIIGTRLQDESGLGAGEAFSFPAARRLGAKLCIDDKIAIRRANLMIPGVITISTPDIMVAAIRNGIIEISEADKIKDQWHSLGPKFGFSSFREIL